MRTLMTIAAVLGSMTCLALVLYSGGPTVWSQTDSARQESGDSFPSLELGNDALEATRGLLAIENSEIESVARLIRYRDFLNLGQAEELQLDGSANVDFPVWIVGIRYEGLTGSDLPASPPDTTQLDGAYVLWNAGSGEPMRFGGLLAEGSGGYTYQLIDGIVGQDLPIFVLPERIHDPRPGPAPWEIE